MYGYVIMPNYAYVIWVRHLEVCALIRMSDLRFCSKKGFYVESYGTGSVIKLPGAAPEQPNVYEFGTTYEYMYQDLLRKDPQLYPF